MPHPNITETKQQESALTLEAEMLALSADNIELERRLKNIQQDKKEILENAIKEKEALEIEQATLYKRLEDKKTEYRKSTKHLKHLSKKSLELQHSITFKKEDCTLGQQKKELLKKQKEALSHQIESFNQSAELMTKTLLSMQNTLTQYEQDSAFCLEKLATKNAALQKARKTEIEKQLQNQTIQQEYALKIEALEKAKSKLQEDISDISEKNQVLSRTAETLYQQIDAANVETHKHDAMIFDNQSSLLKELQELYDKHHTDLTNIRTQKPAKPLLNIATLLNTPEQTMLSLYTKGKKYK